MDRVFISWSVENWLTVLLMAGLGYLLFALLFQALRNLGLGRTSQGT